MNVKEQIKNSLSIVDVVGRYVSLNPAGKNYKGLCPFHTEKTPSFFVMPEKESYTCFGCNQFGDVFSIIMEMEGLSFVEAMNFLIDNYNLSVEKKEYRTKNSVNDYYKINEFTLNYFKKNLLNTNEGLRADKYLKDRGISSNTISEFSIGYALNEWDGLYKELTKNSVNIQYCIDLGLLVKSDKGKIYDRFRGRIIFPIYSEAGKVIAFGGRTMFDEPSKYLNSPDTPVYKKSEHLYGFYNTKKFLRENKKAILVEGYFDLVSLYQGGVKNVVASLGTALTNQQIYLMMRFSEKIYVFYDNDEAGDKAAKRAIQMMLEQNLSPYIVKNFSVKDPDDLIRSQGLKEVLEIIDNAEDGFKYILDFIMKDNDINNPIGKKNAVANILNIISKVGDPIIKNEYIKKISDAFNIQESLLQGGKNLSYNNDTNENSAKKLLISASERIVIESLIAYPQLINSVRELFNEKLMSILISRNIIDNIFANFDSNSGIIDHNIIQKNITEIEKKLFRDIFININKENLSFENAEDNIGSAIINLQTSINNNSIKELNKRIKAAARNNEIEKVNKLMEIKKNFLNAKYKQ